MGLFSRKEKRKPQDVDIYAEVERIAQFMYEYEGRTELIDVPKILISERDYNLIAKEISRVIIDTLQEKGIEDFKIISQGQKTANRIIDKIYDIEWNY